MGRHRRSDGHRSPWPAVDPGGPDPRRGHPHGHDHHEHDLHDHDHPGGVAGLVRSVLSPHRHDTSDTIAAALTGTRDGLRALGVSLVVLGITAGLQLVIVVASGSVGLLSDTIHNFADALTAVPLGVAFWMGRRPPTPRYTYGYGRAEDLAGVFIVLVMAASSVLAAWEAVNRLAHPRPLSGVGWVAAAGVIGFAGNESIAVYRIRVGRRIGSAALTADGRHARTDGLTSLAVVAGAVGAAAGWRDADPVVGLLITAAVLVVLRSAARDIYRRLMDSVDPELVAQAGHVLAQSPGVRSVSRVRLRWVGHQLLAEAEIVADGSLPLSDAHAVAEQAHHHLLHELPRLAQATIHLDPYGTGVDHHSLTAHHFAEGRPPVSGDQSG